MKLKLILLLLPLVLLTGCGIDKTPDEVYNDMKNKCTMTGYYVKYNSYNNLAYCNKNDTRQDTFSDCASSCDKAIDDYRDSNSENM